VAALSLPARRPRSSSAAGAAGRVPGFQQRDQPEPATEQFQLGDLTMGAGGDDLARPADPVSAVLGPGQGVAAGGKRLGAGEVVTAGAGQRDRLLAQLDPLGGAGQGGQRDRQPGSDQRSHQLERGDRIAEAAPSPSVAAPTVRGPVAKRSTMHRRTGFAIAPDGPLTAFLTVAGAGPEGGPITERRRDGKIANQPTFVPLHGFDVEVRKVIYSTNAIWVGRRPHPPIGRSPRAFPTSRRSQVRLPDQNPPSQLRCAIP
jgi:hypothetical protein